MPGTGFRVEIIRGVPVVVTPEEIDITNADELRSALLQAAERGDGDGRLVVDMTRTQFCDSSGLRTLLVARKRAQSDGSQLLLAASSAPVLRLLALTGVDQMLPHYATLDEALGQATAPANGRTVASCR